MKLQDMASSTSTRIERTVKKVTENDKVLKLRSFTQLERVLALLCLAIPLLLIWFDRISPDPSQTDTIRGSISAYFDMVETQIFYFPLTAAVMLFIFNGVVRRRHLYNLFLGLALAGVIVFNHDDWSWVHSSFAVAFFGGNFLVILLFSGGKEGSKWSTQGKGVFLAGIVLAMVGHFALDWYSLFWAEWLSFAIIAIHFILDSWTAGPSWTPSWVHEYTANPGRGRAEAT